MARRVSARINISGEKLKMDFLEKINLIMNELGADNVFIARYGEFDPNSPMVFSDQFKKILGFTPMSAEFPDIMQSWITRIHPDDVPGASEAMGKQLADPSGATVFDMEYRMKHKNGDQNIYGFVPPAM